MNPLQSAVVEGNVEVTEQLKASKWRFIVDKHGFTPLELAQLLGRHQCQAILQKEDPKCFMVQIKGQTSPLSYSQSELEAFFNIQYRSFLTFPSYKILEEIIKDCPYLFRLESLFGTSDAWEVEYQKQLAAGVSANTIIKWIDPVFEYGLFAAKDLHAGSFIGEYTGIIRQIDKKQPIKNGYCFHYPTKFWSLKYFVIDAYSQGNLLRFVNDSQQPNLQPLWLNHHNVLHLILIAKTFISKGTQLTFNYGNKKWMHAEQ